MTVEEANMFITFEGGEGSGKTTVVKKVAEELIKLNYEVLITREPGGSKVAEQIRNIILDKNNTSITAETEALLFAASRTQHLEEIIIPALKRGQIVLCDRFVDSSLAYQAYARELGFDFVLKANDYAMKNLPELTFYCDVDPELGLKRISTRDNLNRLDLENIAFHEKVRNGYKEVVKRFPNRVVEINANGTIDEMLIDIMRILKERL